MTRVRNRKGREERTSPPPGGTGKSTPGEEALLRRIAEKAYEIYQSRGELHGHDLDDWLEAERLVFDEVISSATLRRKEQCCFQKLRKVAEENPIPLTNTTPPGWHKLC